MEQIFKKIKPVFKRHQVRKAAIFGSYARGEEKKRSDFDFLIEFKGKKSLFDLAALRLDLMDQLNKKVDLVTYRSINPRLRSHIMSDAIRIL